MSDLVSPFLSLSPTWVDISRMPLALINCMHDEGNAAGRWYMNHSFRLFCNSSCLPVKFIVISAAFQLQLVPLDFCSDLHPRPRQFADCARALAAHRVCLHCNLSTTQHEPLSARHTSHVTRHTSHVTRHTLRITRHTSQEIMHLGGAISHKSSGDTAFAHRYDSIPSHSDLEHPNPLASTACSIALMQPPLQASQF